MTLGPIETDPEPEGGVGSLDLIGLWKVEEWALTAKALP
ncbi:hypothetical protein MESS4_p20036 [Mesorhizobium sp. STM 4661]|nr:hypothetical protein MESS4_p20036 [Mesorhizobium sp. STM 4661]